MADLLQEESTHRATPSLAIPADHEDRRWFFVPIDNDEFVVVTTLTTTVHAYYLAVSETSLVVEDSISFDTRVSIYNGRGVSVTRIKDDRLALTWGNFNTGRLYMMFVDIDQSAKTLTSVTDSDNNELTSIPNFGTYVALRLDGSTRTVVAQADNNFQILDVDITGTDPVFLGRTHVASDEQDTTVAGYPLLGSNSEQLAWLRYQKFAVRRVQLGYIFNDGEWKRSGGPFLASEDSTTHNLHPPQHHGSGFVREQSDRWLFYAWYTYTDNRGDGRNFYCMRKVEYDRGAGTWRVSEDISTSHLNEVLGYNVGAEDKGAYDRRQQESVPSAMHRGIPWTEEWQSTFYWKDDTTIWARQIRTKHFGEPRLIEVIDLTGVTSADTVLGPFPLDELGKGVFLHHDYDSFGATILTFTASVSHLRLQRRDASERNLGARQAPNVQSSIRNPGVGGGGVYV